MTENLDPEELLQTTLCALYALAPVHGNGHEGDLALTEHIAPALFPHLKYLQGQSVRARAITYKEGWHHEGPLAIDTNIATPQVRPISLLVRSGDNNRVSYAFCLKHSGGSYPPLSTLSFTDNMGEILQRLQAYAVHYGYVWAAPPEPPSSSDSLDPGAILRSVQATRYKPLTVDLTGSRADDLQETVALAPDLIPLLRYLQDRAYIEGHAIRYKEEHLRSNDRAIRFHSVHTDISDASMKKDVIVVIKYDAASMAVLGFACRNHIEFRGETINPDTVNLSLREVTERLYGKVLAAGYLQPFCPSGTWEVPLRRNPGVSSNGIGLNGHAVNFDGLGLA